MRDKRIVCYKYRGQWCEGDGNDFSKPIIDESMLGEKYITLHNILSSCKSRQVRLTHQRHTSNLTILDMFMLWPKDNKCPVLGIPLKLTSHVREHNTPSIDRIIPSRGYQYGNVRIISWLANMVKGDKTKASFFMEKAKDQFEIYSGLAKYLDREIRPDFEI
jgi:hypothetical protein